MPSLCLCEKGLKMGWVVVAVGYVVVGLGVCAWCVRGNATQDSDQKKRSARALVLFPELCLFWPIALVLEIRRKRTVKKAGDARVD